MSKNLQMVKLFHSEFYHTKRVELTEIISPTFSYHSPLCGHLNFTEYVEFLSHIGVHSSAVKTLTTTKDDRVFDFQFAMKVLDFVDGFDEEMIGNGRIIVEDNLIEKYHVTYSEDFLKSDTFAKIKAKLMGDLENK